MTVLAAVIAGAAGALTGYVVENLSAASGSPTWMRLVHAFAGGVVTGFIVVVALAVVIFPSASTSEIVGTLVAAHLAGWVTEPITAHLSRDEHPADNETAVIAMQALVACMSVILGSALALQL